VNQNNVTTQKIVLRIYLVLLIQICTGKR